MTLLSPTLATVTVLPRIQAATSVLLSEQVSGV
jgi:hypothetical protein